MQMACLWTCICNFDLLFCGCAKACKDSLVWILVCWAVVALHTTCMALITIHAWIPLTAGSNWSHFEIVGISWLSCGCRWSHWPNHLSRQVVLDLLSCAFHQLNWLSYSLIIVSALRCIDVVALIHFVFLLILVFLIVFICFFFHIISSQTTTIETAWLYMLRIYLYTCIVIFLCRGAYSITITSEFDLSISCLISIILLWMRWAVPRFQDDKQLLANLLLRGYGLTCNSTYFIEIISALTKRLKCTLGCSNG